MRHACRKRALVGEPVGRGDDPPNSHQKSPEHKRNLELLSWPSLLPSLRLLQWPSAFNGGLPPFFFKVELVQLKLMLCCPSLVQEKARTFSYRPKQKRLAS
ncbi:hypothetical protein VNO80_33906 [Phaseolus coccineus]|uniref:Uncharacterized protein n=1 Tax=Phaseolus coccineus TaxID=3886 RepID=A0AAN9KY85_PHACN